MSALFWMLIVLSFLEILLLGVVVSLFSRLKRSEEAVAEIQRRHKELQDKIGFNARMEQELVASFAERQRELVNVAEEMELREVQLKKLLRQADELLRSPHTLRKLIQEGRQQGRSLDDLARALGLTVDEVEILLIEQPGG